MDGHSPYPEQDQSPVTTIGWRLAHIAVDNLGTRASAFFGESTAAADADMFDERHRPPVPGSAAEALSLLDDVYQRWRHGVAALDDQRPLAPVGAKGAYYADDPMAALVLHVSRETMHHGGEIGVLRDLYRSGLG